MHPEQIQEPATDAVELDAITQVGIGCYRMSRGVELHHAALERALQLGCTLIDTAANYGDGKSEELIGEVLSSNAQYKAFVITKAGYITSSTADRLEAAGVDTAELHRISPESQYSIAPDVLRVQLEESRKRLGRQKLDAVLLHNPEHYINSESVKHSPEGFRGAIQKAFEVLEEYIAEGKLRYYGVSSNTLAAPPGQADRICFHDLLSWAEEVSPSHHFRFVEFPFNLGETEAKAPQANGPSLIDQIRASGLRSIANRPLNSPRGNQLLRFATYDEAKDLVPEQETAPYEQCVNLIADRLRHADLPHKVMDFSVMQFLRDNWHGIEHPDTVDQIFGRHFYPFVEQLWGEEITPDVKAACASLHLKARAFAQQNLTARGEQLREELIGAGTISSDDRRPLAVIACDYPLQSGMDHVLVGMRTPQYVEGLRQLITKRVAH
jgi:aryl-alcohol dehydrogenase-like predicted oxidoreductase